MFHYLIRTDQADIAVEADNIPDSLKKYGIVAQFMRQSHIFCPKSKFFLYSYLKICLILQSF